MSNLPPLPDPDDPRYEIELAKAGEAPSKGYFGGSRFSSGRTRTPRTRQRSSRGFTRFTQTYKVQCPYCLKIFTRKTSSTKLNKHKDPNGWPCSGRSGYRAY